MDVAVVGGGVFGVTTAIELANEGVDVDLFERANDILTAASWSNQLRLHRGYHYPRSVSTALDCRQSSKVFRKRFPGAVIAETDHYYAIASEETKTSPSEFIDHCDRLGLEYERADLDLVDDEMVDLVLRVQESRWDPAALRSTLSDELDEAGVAVHLNNEVESVAALEREYDFVVVATYADTNDTLEEYPTLQQECKYQLCEKPVVRIPERFTGNSLVVMDGPFMCFDPYGRTGNFLLGNVVHAVHETTIDSEYDLNEEYRPLVNAGVVEDPSVTNFETFVDHGSEFIPGLAEAEHVGSMFTFRTVLPYREETDERPTIVESKNNVFKIFSGKFGTAVQVAERVRAGILRDG